MNTTRWVSSAAVLALAYGFATNAWSADAAATPPSPPPSKTVSSDDDTDNSKPDSTTASKPAPAKSAKATPKSDNDDKNGDFKPSEEISEDMAVAYPTDI